MSAPSPLQLVFVGGSPRSGTTLIQRLLGAHSQVYAGPEFDYILALAALRDKMVASVDNGRISAIANRDVLDDSFRKFVRNIFEAKADAVGMRVFSEKTPANLLFFKTLLRIFSDARFVMVLRHPYDIAASTKEVASKHRMMGKRPPNFCRDVQMSAKEIDRYWHAGFEAAAAYPGRVHIVHYEDAVETAGQVAAELCRFLGLPDEPEMVRIEQAKFESTETGVAGWYPREELQAPVRKSREGVAGQRLSPSERSVIVRTMTVRHAAIERYGLSADPGLPGTTLAIRLKASRKFRQIARSARRVFIG